MWPWVCERYFSTYACSSYHIFCLLVVVAFSCWCSFPNLLSLWIGSWQFSSCPWRPWVLWDLVCGGLIDILSSFCWRLCGQRCHLFCILSVVCLKAFVGARWTGQDNPASTFQFPCRQLACILVLFDPILLFLLASAVLIPMHSPLEVFYLVLSLAIAR